MAAVAAEVKEVGREMANNPTGYREYNNNTSPRLPKPPEKSWYYIEGRVDMGQAQGGGQYRVVCLVDNKDKVRKKYYTPTHYGTGTDAGNGPDWIEFE